MSEMNWQSRFNEIFNSENKKSILLSDSEFKKSLITSKYIFPELIIPWVKYALIQIENASIFKGDNGKDIILETLSDLAMIISDHSQFIFYDGFHNYRKENIGSIPGPLRKSYVKKRNASVFFGYKETLALAEILTNLTLSWINDTLEFSSRLELDLNKIQKSFGIKNNDQILSIVYGFSDRHNSARTVKKIIFTNGIQVLYKPRKMCPEIFIDHFLKYLSTINIEPPFKTPLMLDEKTYGWQIFISATSFHDTDSVEKYFINMGKTLSIFKLLGTTDIHEENLITSGTKPYIVDLETAVQPNYKITIGFLTPAIKHAKKRLQDSIFNTSMLPIWTESLDGFPMLSGALNYQSNFSVQKWTAINSSSDNIRYVNKKTVIRKCVNHIVFLNGKKCNVNRYISQISAGMNFMWEEFIQKKNQIILFLDEYPNFEFRVLPRSTVVYGALLKNLKNPKKQASIELAKSSVQVKYDESPPQESFLVNPRFIKAEKEALMRLDVPIFKSYFDSINLETEYGEIKNVFNQSARQLIRKRLKGIDKSDILIDLKLIRISLGGVKRIAWKKKEIKSIVIKNIKKSQIDLKIHNIFSLIKQEAFRKEGSVTWISRYQNLDKSIGIDSILSGLYGGLGGLGIFIAGYYKQYKTKESYQLINEIVNSMELMTEKSKKNEFKKIGIDGITGTIYSLLTIAKLSDILRANSIANKLILTLNEHIEVFDSEFDLLYSPVGLLALWDQPGLSLHSKKAVLKPALDLLLKSDRLRKLLNDIVNNECDDDVLLGLGHGLAGLYLALGRVSNNDIIFKRFHDKVEEAILSGYEKETKSWPFYFSYPLRPKYPGSIDFHKWCHGSIGIGLAASVNHRRKNAAKILELTRPSLSSGFISNVDFLCCGNAGKLEYAIELEKQNINKEEISQLKLKLLNHMLNKNKFKLEELEISDNVTFFRGIAGIGYTLLRIQNPELPCVVTLE